MKKTILAIAALAFMAWGCSSNDDDQPNPPSLEIQKGEEARPDWAVPNFDLYEQVMSVDIYLQDTLQSYVSDADLVCAKIDDEVRGVAQPKQVDGKWMFLLTIAADTSGESITLYYYCDQLHRIFTTYWTRFDASLSPTGTSDLYTPVFLK